MKQFVTMRQLGQMLMGWAALMAVLFLWDLLEIGEAVHIIALNNETSDALWRSCT